MAGRQRSSASSTSTLVPSRAKTLPSSKPITPAPITSRRLGISGSWSASVEEMTRSLSMRQKGRSRGLEPVAMTMWALSISTVPPAPSTATRVGARKRATPCRRWILFFSISLSMPRAVSCTTLSLRARMAGQSTESLSRRMPCPAKALAAWW
jgi:hypothetical protein